MKIGVDRGHNSDKDMGANGIRLEGTMINEVAYPLINMLKEAGHTVYDITGNGRSLTERVTYSKTLDLDFIVSIHFNAFDGDAHGVEVLYISESGKKLAQPVLTEIVKLGFVNRGFKVRPNLHVLKATNCPAFLVEGCFCDSAVDMKLYNKTKLVNAIFKGITGKAYVAKVIKKAVAKPRYSLVLKLGAKGEAVRYLQKAIEAKVDGVFGINTMAKVVAYQKKNGLVRDGIVGKLTWAKIK